MTAQEVLAKAIESGVFLYVEDDQLRYRARSGELSAQLKSELRQHRGELVQHLKRVQATAAGDRFEPPPVRPRDPGGRVPLSYAQQRLWFIDRLGKGSAPYHAQSAYRLTGRLDVAAFKRALATIVERHETLRTVLAEIDGTPYQVVLRQFELDLTEIDLRGMDGGRQEAEVRRLTVEDAQRPFDLGRDLMFRVHLIALAAETRVVLFSLHHVASDGWSQGIFRREFAALYAAYLAGRPNPLAPLRLQYADYTVWQRSWLEGGILAKELEYWKRQLRNLPEVHELPLDRERPAVQGFAGGGREGRIGGEVLARIRSLCKRQDVTLFMFLHAAFSVLLGRWGGDTDIMMGTPVAGRVHHDLEPIMGLFVNTLVLRTRLEGNPAFEDLLARDRQHVLDALTHQHVPFERLVEELKPRRSPSYSPVFQILFSMQPAERQEFSLPGVSFEAIDDGLSGSKFEIVLNVAESADELAIDFGYSAEIFSGETGARMAASFAVLLEKLLADPGRRIDDVDLLTRAERERLTAESNGRPAAPAWNGIHELFEQSARRHPGRIMVACEGRRLTYEQMDRWAGRFARRLVEQGVGPGTRVALALPAPVDSLVALLGTLKAGGIYILIDPRLPAHDRAAILRDARAEVLVTEGPDLEESGDAGGPWVSGRGADARDLAFVAYDFDPVRGWSGRPVEHRQVLDYLLWRQADFEPGGEHRILCTDLSDPEVLTAWAAGATLVVPGMERAVDAGALARLIGKEEVTALSAPPAVLARLLTVWSRCGASLRRVVTGRRHLRRELADLFFQTAKGCELHALYAPAGSPLAVAAWHCSPADDPRRAPLGSRLPGAAFHVLDGDGRPLPEGARGELHVTATAVTRDGHTGRRLVPDPFSHGPESLLYRTGDLARRAPGGNLELLGSRADRARIGGVRVDLAGFRSVLAAAPGIERFVVAVRADAAQRELLAAYVVCAGPPAELPEGWLGPLHIALAAALDDQPVPFAVVVLDEIPLANDGDDEEVLFDSLPLPDETFAPQELFLRPTTETERRMEPIWRKVLPDQPIGIADNFFGLGGHSLSMIVLIKRISQELGVDIPLATFMQSPTLQAVSREVDAARGQVAAPAPPPPDRKAGDGAGPSPAIVPLSDAERGRPLPLSFAQTRIWFITRLEEGRSSYNIPGALLFTGPLGRESLRRSFETILARHAVLRTVYREEDRQPVQVILDRVAFPLPLIDLDGLSPEAQARSVSEQVRAESIRRFDLAAEPSLRALLLKLSAQRHVLLVNMHHIASDGWSIGVLVKELNALYSAYRQGRPNPLPELPVQYCDYAVWQREWQRTHLEAHLSFWRERLSGIPKVHGLPLDKSRPVYQSYAGAHHAVTLGRTLAGRLEELSRSSHGTLFITLQAALAVLIHRFSGETDIVLGAPVANRLQREVEPLIGCFVNTLVLRSDLAGNPRFIDLLAAAGESVRQAYAHQSVPFELLVEEINPPRDLSHTPLFQIVLAFQNDEGEELDLPDLAFTRVESDYPVSKFDLTLYARQMPEGLSLVWEYATGIFTRETVESLASSFGVLLESIVRAPAERIDALRLIAGDDERRLLRQAGGTGIDPEDALCVHELFEARARERPEAVAVTGRQGPLTYGALNGRADRLARHLGQRGVRPGTLVGICAERSLEMIVGLLAILKAGAAYVPLEAGYPPERLRYMVEDSGVGVVLTSRALWERLPASPPSLLLLDDLAGGDPAAPPAGAGGEPPRPALGPESLAYVIYTSGSTGQPKGAAIEHRGVTRLVWRAGYMELGEETVTLQHSAMSFDTSTFEIWAPLLNGGVLALLDGDSADIEGLARQVEERGVNTLWLTSGVLPLWAEEHHRRELGLRYLLVGGDVVPPRSVEEIYRRDPEVTIINGYGPTENTTFSCCYRVPREREGVAALPIGEPVRRTSVYVLDRHLRLQPAGCPGELHVGGAGVARGYVNQPRLTGRQFVPNPFSAGPGERLYKTGDVVRWLPDGNLGFLGRKDQQVKVRGFRVELGEIEAQLSRLPGIADSAVLASDARGTGNQLVAYLVPAPGDGGEPAGPPAAGLRERCRSQLRRSLPEHMVPATYIVLERMPLTPNGKIDRRALPAPAESDLEKKRFVAPRTATERRLCEIWREVLKLEQVGVGDDFFALGGHSLLATRFISAVRESFDVEVPLRMVFEKPTILEFATWLDIYNAAAAADDGEAEERFL